jgi:hypothetical protein
MKYQKSRKILGIKITTGIDIAPGAGLNLVFNFDAFNFPVTIKKYSYEGYNAGFVEIVSMDVAAGQPIDIEDAPGATEDGEPNINLGGGTTYQWGFKFIRDLI